MTMSHPLRGALIKTHQEDVAVSRPGLRDEAPTVRFATPPRPERPILELEDALDEAWTRGVEKQGFPRQSQPHSTPVHRPRKPKTT